VAARRAPQPPAYGLHHPQEGKARQRCRRTSSAECGAPLRAAGVLQRRLKLVLFRRFFVVFVIFSFYICNTPFYLLRTVYTIRKKRKKRSTTTTCCFCYCFYLLFLSLVFFLVFVPFFFGAVPLPAAAFRCHTGPTALPLHF
jgi:hypothetical protein